MAIQNVVSTEVVEFRAEGIDELIDKARQLGLTTEEATKKAEQSVYRVEQVARRTASAVGDATAGMGQRAKGSKWDSGLAAWQTDYGTAALARQAREAQRIANEMQRGGQRWVDHFRAGVKRAVTDAKQLAAMGGQGIAGARAGLGVMPGLGTAGGIGAGFLAYKGFQGTVEANKMDREIELLGREVAGAFKPVTDELTAAIRSLRQWMEQFTPRDQDKLMAGGLAVAGTAGVAKATGKGPLESFGLLAGLAFIGDKLDIGVKTYRAIKEQNQYRSGDYSLNRSDFESTGYGRFASIRDPKERQKAIDEELAKLDEMKKQNTQSVRKNPASYIAGTMNDIFGFGMFGDSQFTLRKALHDQREITKHQKALQGLKNDPNAFMEGGPNDKRRRVTPDSIAYGEVGSSYDEAVIGLMKVNAASGEKTGDALLREIIIRLEEIRDKKDPTPNKLEKYTY